MKRTIFRRAKLLVVVALLTSTLCFTMVSETGAYLYQTSGTYSHTLNKLTSTSLSVTGTWPKLQIKNNTNVPLYIRIAFAVNYVNAQSGNWSGGTARLYLARAPKSSAYTNDDGTSQSAEYSYSVGGEWQEKNITEAIGNVNVTWKILYRTAPLAGGATSGVVFNSFTGNVDTRTHQVESTNRTFSLNYEMIVDGIQCETSSRFSGGVTDTAVYKAWGVTPASVGGNLSSFPSGDAYVAP